MGAVAVVAGLVTVSQPAIAGPTVSSGKTSVSKPLQVKTDAVWTNLKIPVCWEDGGWSKEKGWVKRAALRTWQKVSRLRFTGWGRCSSRSKGIRIAIANENPHVKALGRHLDGMKDGMVLSFEFDVDGFRNCRNGREYCIDAIAVHEFGHAIGIAHEHNRTDRLPGCDKKHQGSDGDWYVTRYDLKSVMNYCNPKWNGNGALSRLDIEGVREVYGGPGPEVTTISGRGRYFVSHEKAPAATALLSSFSFGYENGDHQMRGIYLLPGLRFVPQIRRSIPDKRSVLVGFFDKNGDDRFHYSASFKSLASRKIKTGSKSGTCSKGQCRYKLKKPAGHVFVLRGFSLSYQDGDHHIDEVAVYTSGDKLYVHYNDKNDDDRFRWQVDYAWVPASMVRKQGVRARGSTSRGIAHDQGERELRVIQGFRFDYNSSDHHLEEIGVNDVSPTGRRMYVRFNDDNDDDRFSWQVTYATLR